MRWEVLPVDAKAAECLGHELGVTLFLARLLVRRGLAEPEAAQAFLHPALSQLHDPYLMAGMKDAVAPSRVAQTCLVDALYLLVARYRKVSFARTERLNSIVEKKLRLPGKS